MKKYPLFKVHTVTQEVLSNLEVVLHSGFINEGEQVSKLTELLSKRFNTEHLVLTNSCTSSLTMALHLCDVKHNDVVISTPMTCVATNMPIVNCGANIYWCDINKNSGMIDVEQLEKCLKEDLKFKAVVVVCWAGIPPNLEGIYSLCKKHNVKLIVDAAHAFDATYNGKQLHEYCDFCCYSFQAIKHFSTGDGGCLISKSKEDYLKSKKIKWFGLDRDQTKDFKGNWKGQQWDVDIEDEGYKFNMNNLTASIGLSQLNHIDSLIEKHRNNAIFYNELFKDVDQLIVPLETGTSNPSYWVYSMLLSDYVKVNRDQLLQKLNDLNINAGIVHVPNHYYTVFKSFYKELINVDQFSKSHFALPCGWWLNDDDIRYIANEVKKIIT